MNELHLFAGIGGGILGSLLCGHRIVCAVEIEPYCQSVLVQKQNDGQLPPFPIWDDIRTFDGRKWREIVDVVSGGFPCQNISNAGNRTGIYGEKSSLWFEMLRVIREVRPQYVFVENSAGLIRNGLDVVLGGLSKAGYDAQWCVLGADDVGANHHRKRVWILAYTNGERKQQPKGSIENDRRWIGNVCEKTLVSYAACKRCESFGLRKQQTTTKSVFGNSVEFGNSLEWWSTEPAVCRMVDGCANRLDRIRGLGNAQVPLCAATAWKILYERINEQ